MISKTVREAAEAADVQDTYGTDVNGYEQHTITPHALRHAFAVHAAENGIPAPHLKEMMGHMKLDVTQIYLDVAEESAVEIMKSKGPSLE
jgi:integrase/recombinase XerD